MACVHFLIRMKNPTDVVVFRGGIDGTIFPIRCHTVWLDVMPSFLVEPHATRRCRLPALPALTALWSVVLTGVTPAMAAEPIPDKLVVLTFDEGNTSDLRTVVPILKQHGFGATFSSRPAGSEARAG